jgi:tetratricopeptide (TPR) repeat protein
MKKKYFLIAIFLCLLYKASESQELKGEEIYAKINNAIVTIYASDATDKILSQGSGVVLNDKGWIVTNYHVYAGADKLVVKLKDKIIEYTSIVGLDVEKDILILKIKDNTFQSIKIGNSDLLKVGQKIYALGSPLGFENTITEGIISGLRYYKKEAKNFIQISAAISHGSSGGAVVDSKGELIGISTLTVTEGQNLNFAIPINEVLTVYNQKGIKQNQIDAAVYFYRGKYEYDRQSYDAAIGNYKKAIALLPDKASIYNNIGIAYIEKGDIETAITCYKKAISINPKTDNVYYNLGNAYALKEEFDNAIYCLQKEISLNPNDNNAYRSLGAAYSGKGDDETAIIYLKRAVDLNPNDNDSYRTLGNIYAIRKEFDTAIFYLKKAISISIEDAEALYILGITYGLKGDNRLEKYYKEKAYKIDPSLKE